MKKIATVSFLLISVLFSFSQTTYCDSNTQWVPYEHTLPVKTKSVYFTDVYKNELYALAIKDSIFGNQLADTLGRIVRILKLDTSNKWHILTEFEYHPQTITCFKVYKGEIFIGGYTRPGVPPVFKGLSKFDGSNWTSYHSLLNIGSSSNNGISDMEVYKGELYICGDFIGSTMTNSQGIAKFDGTTWKSIASKMDASWARRGTDLTIHNNLLYLGGQFKMTTVGSNQNIAAWNGTKWLAVPSINRMVYEMHSNDSLLMVAAYGATKFGSQSIKNIAYLKNNTWSPAGNPKFSYDVQFQHQDTNLYIYDQHNGVRRFEKNKWIPFSSILTYGNAFSSKAFTVYNGQIIVPNAKYSCGLNINNQFATLCDTTICGRIKGRVFLDTNKNCIDNQEQGYGNSIIDIGNGAFLVCDSNGGYSRMIFTGSYTIKHTARNYFSNYCPASGSITTTITAGNTSSGNNFALEVTPNKKDLQVVLTQGRSSVGRSTLTYISIKNVGTTSLTGSVLLEFDSIFTFDSTSVSMVKLNNKLTWNFGTLGSLKSKMVKVYFHIPRDPKLVGTRLRTFLTGTIMGYDEDSTNNVDVDSSTVVGAYDPNFKEVSPVSNYDASKEEGPILVGSNDKYVYTIHFQNTGTDTAYNVILVDELDTNLIPQNLEILSSSHPVNLQFYGKTINFKFDNILLPDSGTNYIESQGFVKYRISAIPNISVGDKIKNTASIYFDYNPAIVTNTVTNTIVKAIDIPIDTTGVSNPDHQTDGPRLKIYPNPVKDVLNIELIGSNSDHPIHIYMTDISGRTVKSLVLSHNSNLQLTRDELTTGIYLLSVIVDGKNIGTYKFIIED